MYVHVCVVCMYKCMYSRCALCVVYVVAELVIYARLLGARLRAACGVAMGDRM